MDRHRAFGRLQCGQRGEERAHLGGLRRHDGLGRAGRLGGVAGQREDEAADAPCRPILASKLPVDRGDGLVAIAADRERQGEPAAHLGILLPAQRQSVIRLGAAGIAVQVMREAAVASELRLRHAEAGRILEEFEAGMDLLHLDERRAHPRLDAAVAGAISSARAKKVKAACGSPSSSAALPAPISALTLRGWSAMVRRWRVSAVPALSRKEVVCASAAAPSAVPISRARPSRTLIIFLKVMPLISLIQAVPAMSDWPFPRQAGAGRR